jgi:glycosyltransferase involved in cell wall biosynthesis
MKICRFIPDFPSSSRITSTGQDSAKYLGPNTFAISREQRLLGNEVHVICKGNGTVESLDGINVHRVKSPYNLNGFFEVEKIGLSGRIDILHVHATSAYGIARARKLVSSAKVVAHVHGTTAGSSFVSGTSHRVSELISNARALARERLVWKSAARVVAVSDDIANELIHCYGVPSKRVRVVYNGVDTDAFKPSPNREALREKLGWEGRQVALYVGQISPRKGLTYLIESAKIVCEKLPEVLFALAGGVPSYQESSTFKYFEKLRGMADRYGLSKNVIFLGAIPNSQLPEYHTASDLFVFPSLYEGAPKAVLEAMSCGKPVVATMVGGIRTLVSSSEGRVVRPSDPKALADAILSVLSDKESLKKMGISAREKICRDFTWRAAAVKLQNIYNELY